MKKGLIALLFYFLAYGLLLAGGQAEAGGTETAWLKKAQLGSFTQEAQDWEAIEAAAREEGQVVIYSLSSRIFKLVDEFKEKYGIEIVAFDLSSDVQLERFKREHRAGRYTVDVLYNREISMILNEFLPEKLVWNFIPDTVEDFLDENEKEPLLIQRWSSRVLFYNTALNPEGSPIDSLWDLTREEWKGRLLLLDPLADSFDANMLQTILQHADEMDIAYKKEFGKQITFSEDLVEVTEEMGLNPDASREWLYRLLQNDPVFLGSTTKVFKNVADIKQEKAPIGMTTFSKIRVGEPGVYEAKPVYELEPVIGVSSPTSLIIADQAPHPNAAKLLIRYLMEEGFWPWDEPGDYAARSDVETSQLEKYNIPPFDKLKTWAVDTDYTYNTKFEFINFFVNIR